MISIQHVHKSFDGHRVLNDVTVDMQDGQCNMIIGQSGSGKTVLMKSLIGLHGVDSGRIEYDGRNLPDMSEKEVRLLHREVGMLFQGAALFDSLTVMQNVLFPLEMWAPMTRREREERARFCLERVNISNVAWNLSPAEISGGMQKRVAIARAIALNPRYLFCDEPNSGLDPKTSLVIDQLIHEITQEYNICTVINSHDMNSIMEIGDNIIFLREGHKEWQGSRHEIFYADNAALNDFVFAGDLFKQLKATFDKNTHHGNHLL
ncbi:MAG: ATP-binding cassette domain-containing protein [Paludibacteraceae bacterium]|nr:ATP-binding cassette domain-containing protein [Paludibacteraceae bacterium]